MSEGAKVVFGGEKRKERGYWVDPTSSSILPISGNGWLWLRC